MNNKNYSSAWKTSEGSFDALYKIPFLSEDGDNVNTLSLATGGIEVIRYQQISFKFLPIENCAVFVGCFLKIMLIAQIMSHGRQVIIHSPIRALNHRDRFPRVFSMDIFCA